MADAAYGSTDILTDIWGRTAPPVIDLNHRGAGTPAGYGDAVCPLCPCGTPMRYLGRDRGVYAEHTTAEECGCPGGPTLKSWRIDQDIRLHSPLPRPTVTWRSLYAERTSVERVNSRCKEHLRLEGLRHRGLAKVRAHAGLSLIVLVAGALGMVQAGHREWARSVVPLRRPTPLTPAWWRRVRWHPSPRG